MQLTMTILFCLIITVAATYTFDINCRLSKSRNMKGYLLSDSVFKVVDAILKHKRNDEGNCSITKPSKFVSIW